MPPNENKYPYCHKQETYVIMKKYYYYYPLLKYNYSLNQHFF